MNPNERFALTVLVIGATLTILGMAIYIVRTCQ